MDTLATQQAALFWSLWSQDSVWERTLADWHKAEELELKRRQFEQRYNDTIRSPRPRSPRVPTIFRQ